jgi:hypothetical protein
LKISLPQIEDHKYRYPDIQKGGAMDGTAPEIELSPPELGPPHEYTPEKEREIYIWSSRLGLISTSSKPHQR